MPQSKSLQHTYTHTHNTVLSLSVLCVCVFLGTILLAAVGRVVVYSYAVGHCRPILLSFFTIFQTVYLCLCLSLSLLCGKKVCHIKINTSLLDLLLFILLQLLYSSIKIFKKRCMNLVIRYVTGRSWCGRL